MKGRRQKRCELRREIGERKGEVYWCSTIMCQKRVIN